jgi:hypothetical protein
MTCRYAVLATANGYQPTESRGCWTVVAVEDCDIVNVHIAMVPNQVGAIITVKELVPYDKHALEAWRAAKMQGAGAVDAAALKVEQDMRASTVVMRNVVSKEQHKLLALPLQQPGLLQLAHVMSGAY